jgi:single-stranded-DNA-specific exonuclease
MTRNWRYPLHDSALIGRLARELACTPLMAQVLLARGLRSGTEARTFLSAQIADLHDPSCLPGLDQAADRMVAAIRDGRRIIIYGDYDVDGMTATAILWHCLTLAGASVDYYIPSRLEEGYGLNCEAIRTLHREDPRRLVVTVDCGIASVAEAALARELGLELVITDHHNLCDGLPDATLVHPRLPGSECPFTDLCGAGVAFKLAWGIAQRLGDGRKASPKMRQFLIDAVGLAAIGTIADIVPLRGENRVIVRYGLEVLCKSRGAGLEALWQVAQRHENGQVTCEDIGFAIAPRLNAAGRLGQARLGVELLTTSNRARALQLADYVDQLNKQRQTVERKIFKQAKEIVEASDGWAQQAALVLAHDEWHPGVIGIVASRVAEHFECPAILLALNTDEGIAQGSGRSYAGFDLHAALCACAEHLETFGGHRAAAGLRLRTEALDDFRTALANFTAQTHRPTAQQLDLRIDAEVQLDELTHRAVRELDRLGPFGCANQRPQFAAAGVQLVEPPRRMGGGERHLSLRLRQSAGATAGKVFRAVAFGKGDWAEEIEAVDGPLSISFTAAINEFRGYERVELHLTDWQPGRDA